VRPNGFVAAAHVHPSQEERFEVLKGSVGFKIGRKKLVAEPGQRLTVPAGTPHKFWNAGDDEAHFVCEVRPALQFEQLLEAMFALANDGKTNRKGMPNPLRLAVIAREHFDTVQLPFPPAFMQRAGLAIAAPLGRILGYGATYVPAGDTQPPGSGREPPHAPRMRIPRADGRRRNGPRAGRPRGPESRSVATSQPLEHEGNPVSPVRPLVRVNKCRGAG
jgi:hypothetical protein